MAILTVKKLKKHYGAEPNLVRALDDVDLEINAREFVAVVGQSGSGKSMRQFHQTIIMITHNEHIAQLADQVIHIEDGKIVKEAGRK